MNLYEEIEQELENKKKSDSTKPVENSAGQKVSEVTTLSGSGADRSAEGASVGGPLPAGMSPAPQTTPPPLRFPTEPRCWGRKCQYAVFQPENGLNYTPTVCQKAAGVEIISLAACPLGRWENTPQIANEAVTYTVIMPQIGNRR